MAPQVGWSRSRRWLLETCARRFVLTYPDGLGGSGRPMAPTPRLRLKRLIDGVRRDLFEDRSEGHAWSNHLHRVVLERRMDAAGAALELDGVARRREARHEVRRMGLLMRHPWMAHHLPVGVRIHVPSPLRSVDHQRGPLWAAPQAVVDALALEQHGAEPVRAGGARAPAGRQGRRRERRQAVGHRLEGGGQDR